MQFSAFRENFPDFSCHSGPRDYHTLTLATKRLKSPQNVIGLRMGGQVNGSRTSSGQFKLTSKTAAIVGVSALGVAGLLGVTIWITAHISGGGSGTGPGGSGGGKAPGAAPAAKNVNPPAPLDDAAREARQRALAQIPESSGTVAPVEALRRVPIPIPPPAAAGGKVTAPPTPVKLDVPSGTR